MNQHKNKYSFKELSAYHEKHKLANFIASSKLEGIHIDPPKEGETLESLLKKIKDGQHESL